MRLLDTFFPHTDTASPDPLMPASNPALLVALAAVADAVFVVDTAWRFFYLNDRAAALLGHPRAVLQGTEIWVLCPELRGTVFETEFRRADATGHNLTFEASYPGNSAASLIRAYPSPSGLVVYVLENYVLENTEHSASVAAVRLLEPLLDQIDAAVIATDVDGRVTHWNAHAARLYDWSRAEAIGHPIGALTVGSYDLVAKAATEARLRAGHSWSGDFTARHKDGTTFPAHVTDAPMRDATGQLQGAVDISVDITARTGRDAALTHRATHDPLTGLPNRALFFDRLGHALDRLHHDGTACAVLFLDLDHFKQVNDTFGHGAGDALLVAVAGRLRGAVRPSDTLARLSGDEFTVLLEGVADPAEATAVATRLAAALNKPFAIGGRFHAATTSIGIALSRPAHEQPEDLLRDADAALYLAKAAGRAGHVIYDDRD